MPDSMSSCGELMAPPDKMTWRARFVRLSSHRIAHTCGALAVQQDSFGQRMGVNHEIWTTAHRSQERGRRRVPDAIVNGELKITHAFLRDAIEVVVARNADPRGGFEEGLRARMRFIQG